MRIGRVWAGVTAAGLLATTALAACGDDEEGNVAPKSDAAQPETSTPRDAGGDTASPVDSATDSADAGPTLSVTVGSRGFIEMNEAFAQAVFYEDETIVRSSDTPDCVVFVRSGTKLSSAAGTITIGGPSVGMDGGPDAAIVMDPMLAEGYSYFNNGETYPPGANTTVQVEMTATPTFPTLTVQSLPTPLAGITTITAPMKPDGGAAPDGEKLKISTTKPFTVTWTPPAGALATHRLIVDVTQLANDDGGFRIGDVRCGFPLTSGSGTISAALLADLKARLGGPSGGTTSIEVGGQKTVTVGIATYVLKVGALIAPTTSFNGDGVIFTVLE